MSKYALLLSSAWGITVAEKTALKAVESIFPFPNFTVFPAKRKKHAIHTHIGCRKVSMGGGAALERDKNYCIN